VASMVLSLSLSEPIAVALSVEAAGKNMELRQLIKEILSEHIEGVRADVQQVEHRKGTAGK
jgi:hypothetical protein